MWMPFNKSVTKFTFHHLFQIIMTIEKVREYFRQSGVEDKIIELPQSSARLNSLRKHCTANRRELPRLFLFTFQTE